VPKQDRRQFLRECSLAAGAAFILSGGELKKILIESESSASRHRRMAERELLRGLTRLQPAVEINLTTANNLSSEREPIFRLRVEPGRFKNKESFSISARGGEVTLMAATDLALLYAVSYFLERQGAYFGIDGESYPPELAGKMVLPAENHDWESSPRFAVRGLLPWPDFLNCISVYNDEDFQAYFEAMLRMRFNLFGMHVYTGSKQWAESFLSFDYAGIGHLAYLDNSASNRWGYIPQRISRLGMGAAEFFEGEVFGADATIHSQNPWEIADRTKAALARALKYANGFGIATGIGFEPYSIPDEIFRALPPEVTAKPEEKNKYPGGARFDIESVVAQRMLEARLSDLLESYPEVEYIWLWEDENMNWESRKTGVPLSATPFLQAHDFLRRHAPKKRLVLSGWGGVVRHFPDLHKRIPGDVIFSCLNDSLGWDPVDEIFGRLDGRERWPIPWLEDDPAMWLPQFHVNRTKRDVDLAAKYGCQGILGIHWRHRIMDATAGYLAKATWDSSLTPTSHFAAYARSQAAGNRASQLADILDDADLHQKLLNTGTNQVENGHVVQREFAADYDEGFLYWQKYAPSRDIVDAQKKVASELQFIALKAGSVLERERLDYLAGFIGFAVPYTDSWTLAHQLNAILDEAAKLKAQKRIEEAREKVRNDAIPLWMKIAPLVRDTMLRYQGIISTRENIGQLASMHNKYVRLALVRLRLSIQEYLGELPIEMESLYKQVIQPDERAQTRLIVPTRPGVLKSNGHFRIMIVATGAEPVHEVTLHTRVKGTRDWVRTAATLMDRRTHQATVGPFAVDKGLAAYYVSASIGSSEHVAPLSGRDDPYLVTLL
jgi:hypothetical protein